MNKSEIIVEIVVRETLQNVKPSWLLLLEVYKTHPGLPPDYTRSNTWTAQPIITYDS